jgi:VanZ family protein
VLHFAAYALLAALAINSMCKKAGAITVLVMTYGFALEILQHFVGRTFSVIDISANCIGALTAAVIYCAVNRQKS